MAEEFSESEILFSDSDFGSNSDFGSDSDYDSDSDTNQQHLNTVSYKRETTTKTLTGSFRSSRSSSSSTTSMDISTETFSSSSEEESSPCSEKSFQHRRHSDLFSVDEWLLPDHDNSGSGSGKDDEVMIPPHLIVASRINKENSRSSSAAALKGRNLYRVRNSILRMTGFLEV